MPAFGKRASAAPVPPDPDLPLPPLAARYILSDGRTGDCEVTAIDPDMALFLTAKTLPPQMPLTAFIEDLGRVDGITGGCFGPGVWVNFIHEDSKRSRFTRHLRWLIRRDGRTDRPLRRHTRFEPRHGHASLRLPGGIIEPCEVLDVSLSGAALGARLQPPLGTTLFLGRRHARVTRHFPGGFAIEFLERMADPQLLSLLR